jgi:hypothetical protein
MRIRSFEDFNSLNEGRILVYHPGDNLKASKTMRAVDVTREFQKLLDKGQPFTVTVDTVGVKGADPLHPEMDVIGIDGELVVVKDYKGREFKIKTHKPIEVNIGNSVKDRIVLNLTYFANGERMTIKNNNGKELTVSAQGEVKKIPLDTWKKWDKTQID